MLRAQISAQRKAAVAPYRAAPGPEMVAYNEKLKAQALRRTYSHWLEGKRQGRQLASLLEELAPAPVAKAPVAVEEIEIEPRHEKKSDWADELVKNYLPTAKEQTAHLLSPEWFRGDSHTNVNAIPWSLPAAALARLGGLYAGQEEHSELAKKKRHAHLDKELAQAQEEYRQAMQPDSKEAAAGIGGVLDRLYRLWRKEASANDLLGRASGLYLLLASPFFARSALSAYKDQLGNRPEEALAKLKKKHEALHEQAAPEPIYAEVRRPKPEGDYAEESHADDRRAKQRRGSSAAGLPLPS